jgi:hypothetical protein
MVWWKRVEPPHNRWWWSKGPPAQVVDCGGRWGGERRGALSDSPAPQPDTTQSCRRMMPFRPDVPSFPPPTHQPLPLPFCPLPLLFHQKTPSKGGHVANTALQGIHRWAFFEDFSLPVTRKMGGHFSVYLLTLILAREHLAIEIFLQRCWGSMTFWCVSGSADLCL